MNLEPALKNEQIRLKRELKAIDVVIQKLTLNEYNERFRIQHQVWMGM